MKPVVKSEMAGMIRKVLEAAKGLEKNVIDLFIPIKNTF